MHQHAAHASPRMRKPVSIMAGEIEPRGSISGLAHDGRVAIQRYKWGVKLNDGENTGAAALEEHEVGPGWDALAPLLAGLQPENVQALQAARELELTYPLLHALTRGTLRDFFVRV